MTRPQVRYIPLVAFTPMINALQCCYAGSFPLSQHNVRAYYRVCGCFPHAVVSRVLKIAARRFPAKFPSAGELRELMESEYEGHLARARAVEGRKLLAASNSHASPAVVPYGKGLPTRESLAGLPEGPSKQKLMALAADFEKVEGPEDFYRAMCRAFLPGEPESPVADAEPDKPGQLRQP